MRGSFSACRSGSGFKGVALRAAWIAGVCGSLLGVGDHGSAWAQTNAGSIDGGSSSSLTQYRGTMASGRPSTGAQATGQGIRPQYSQRAFAVGFGSGEVDSSLRDVDLFTLSAQLSDVDLSFPTNGPGVTISRSYNGAQLNAGSAYSSDGYQGHNWFQGARPELVRGTAASSNDMLYLVVGAARVMEFRLAGSSTTLFAGVNGTQAVAKIVADGSGDPGVIEVYDLSGRIWTFFDFDGDAQGAQGQLWKVTDEDGNGGSAYIGTSNTKAAALAAFETESSVRTARVTNMVDASDRNFEFTYTTVGGAKRLASVVAKIKTGGTWASPTGVSEVGRVEYTYYGASESHGSQGNLKWVTTTTPLSSGGSLVRKIYYRYETASGQEHLVKLVVGPEGNRRYVGSGIESESDSALEQYSTHRFTYSGSTRSLATVNFSGECGCSGNGANGTHTLSLEVNSGFSGSNLTNATYDSANNWNGSAWYKRALITTADSNAYAIYFDEVGQQLGKASINGTNWSTYSMHQASKIQRDSKGRVIERWTPASIASYNHSAGTITTDTVGLVHVSEFDDSASPQHQAHVKTRKVKNGTQTGATNIVTVSTVTFDSAASKIWTDGSNQARLTRYLPASSTTYRDSGTADTTTYTRTFYSGAGSWTAKSTVAELPALDSGDTSAPASTNAKSYTYTDAKGRVVFSVDGSGVYTFTKYDSRGQVAKFVRDPLGSDSDVSTAQSAFGLSLSTSGRLHYSTTHTYDEQGRLLTSTSPSGRIGTNHYTQLASGSAGGGQLVTLSVSHQASGTSYGPASVSVQNASGKVIAQGVIGFTGGSTSTAMSGWIDDEDLVLNLAVLTGTLKQLTEHTYSPSGAQLQTSDVYFRVPTTSTSDSGAAADRDRTSYEYDAMGRTRKVVDPTGTIQTTDFDYLGRATVRKIGTSDSGGGANMVAVQTTAYTTNGLVSTQTAHVDTNVANDRVTEYKHDWRSRVVVQINPQPPHSVFAYDDANRTTAVAGYASSSGLSGAPTPSSPTTTTNRVSYAETIYNSRGQVRETKRHEIAQTGGASTDTLSSHQWYDGAGRVIKSRGEQLTKTKFDALGRATNSFVLAKDNDGSTHADATDVAGDTVMEERQNFYDDTSSRKGLMLMSVAISRHPGDTTTTGVLDNVGDGLGVVNMGSASFKGRAQITSYYYDANLDRQTDVVFLGTNGGTTYTRTSDTIAGSRSNDRLITSTTYTTDGLTDMTTDARGIVTKTTYDAARRAQTTIHNFVDGTPGGGTDGDEDQTIEYTYTNGLMTAQKADLPGTSDQTTTYTYDVVATGTLPSTITSKRLLRKVAYPDSSGSTDVVLYAYNRQGQQTGMIDQAGNQVDTTYDLAGRETMRTVTTLASGFDGSVRRIEMAYLSRGMIDTVTQYDAVSSGNATDQVLYKYDDWGNLEWLYQDVDSTMNSSGVSSGDRPSFSIKYESSKKAPSGGVQLISRDYRRSYAGTGGTTQFAAVQYDYGTSGGIDDTMGRVRSVKASLDGTTFTTVATYDYLGAGQLVGTTLNQPNLETKLTSGTGTSTTYPDMDRFGRPTKWDWWRSGGAAFYDVDIAHDENSNPTSTTDNVHVRNSSGNRIFDVLYGLDKLNRVTSADEGELASGSISNRTSKETWALSHTGNWNTNTRDLDGNGTNDLNFSGTFNDANEWTSRTDSVAPFTENMTYDANGNMTSWGYREGDANKYTYVYDGFGRLKKVQTDISGSPWDHAVYRYNGLGYRIQWQYDENINFTLSSSERFYFLYDDRWRIVATFRDTDTSAKENFVYHAAGIAGRGGSSYIDSVILRDKDANTGWTSSGDGTLEDRVFYAQNWRADVVAITKSDGQPTEFIRYTSYGTAQAFAAADVNRDGTVNSTDVTDWDNLFSEASSGAAIPVDFDFDGSSFNPDDNDAFTAAYNEASGWTNGGLGVGGGKLSRIGNRKGYAGYEYDPAIVSYHVRHRVYVPEIGRWTKRDPLGYVDGMSVYKYMLSSPVAGTDASGLIACVYTCSFKCNAQPWLTPRTTLFGIGPCPVNVNGKSNCCLAAGVAFCACMGRLGWFVPSQYLVCYQPAAVLYEGCVAIL